MEKGYGQGDAKIADYVERTFHPEDDALREIRARSTRAGLPEIQVGRLDGILLEVLVRAANAKRAVEIGTLGGYSGVCILRGLGPEGQLHSCELSEGNAEVARESFRLAGFASQATVHVGAALETLPRLVAKGPFDVCFIDADKGGYPRYLEWAADNLRVGGIVLADNTFAWGGIVDSQEPDPAALRAFNAKLAGDRRFRSTIIPTAEGLSMGVKVRA
jgi:caffeoyl-CoA O-methyltransferase